MNIRCPHCQTVFRVNPARIPPKGVRARCARCGETFTVQPPESPDTPSSAADAPVDTTRTRPAPTPAPAGSGARPNEQHEQPTRSPQPRPAAPQPTPAPAPATTPAPSASSTSAHPAPETEGEAPVFGSTDPRKRAARLARALVSDIVAYHPERRDKSLEDGSIRSEFREEILKSWDEYVAQVGIDTAKGTPFFRDALNAILAKGQEVF